MMLRTAILELVVAFGFTFYLLTFFYDPWLSKGLQMVLSRGKNSAKTLHWCMVGYETYSALTNLRYDLRYDLAIYHNLSS